MIKLTEKIANTWKKHEGKIILTGLAATFSMFVAIGESQKIGSYRPEELSLGYTSYVAYDRGNEIWLYLPAIKGMISGPIVDRGKDGSIDYVGSLKYPRVPIGVNLLNCVSSEKKESYQNIYSSVMEKIRRSNE